MCERNPRLGHSNLKSPLHFLLAISNYEYLDGRDDGIKVLRSSRIPTCISIRMATLEGEAPPLGSSAHAPEPAGGQNTNKNNTSTSSTSKKQIESKSKQQAKKKKQKKKNKNKKSLMPKPGEPGYLSPTQLRNARKRRAKQMQKREREQEETTGTAGDGSTKQIAKRSKTKMDARSRAAASGNAKGTTAGSGDDPSLKFLRNPQGAPTVQAARKYFAPLLKQPKTSADDTKATATATASTSGKFQVHVGPTTSWRTVAKLAARPDPADPTGKKVLIGLFQPQSHVIVPVPHCSAHHPSINAAVACLTETCNRLGVAAFDDKRGGGYLRYVAASVLRRTGGVQLTLIWNSNPYTDADDASDDGKKALHRLTTELRRVSHFDGVPTVEEHHGPTKKKRRRGKKARGGDVDVAEATDHARSDTTKNDTTTTASSSPAPPPFRLHSLWIHYNSQWKHSNAIFDIAAPATSSWRLVCGPAFVEETLDIGTAHPVALRFPPNVFRQANLDGFANIVAAIRQRIGRYVAEYNNNGGGGDGKERLAPSCLELYGGVGTIGLNLIDLVSSLTSSDENPNNIACFRGCVDGSSWPEEIKSRAHYVGKNAAKMIEDGSQLAKSDILVVDPPRKGLDGPVLSALTDKWTNQLPQLVVYVSCGFDAFQRDCDAMLESGRWALEHAEGHLLFPGSDAIETLAFFVRKD